MQPRHVVRIVALKLRAQVVGEQAVVAPGAALTRDRAQEQVLGVELLQQGQAVGAGIERGADRGVKLAQQTRAQQEAPHVGRLARQHILGQVIGDSAARSREAIDEVALVIRAVQCDRRQPQGGGPALGLLVQAEQLFAAERVRLAPLFKERQCILQAEAQAIGVDLGEQAAHPQARQPQLRQAARPDDQMPVARQVLGDLAHQTQHGRLMHGFEFVEEQGKRHVAARQCLHGVDAGCGIRSVQAEPQHRLVQAGHEAREVVVGAVQRQPDGGHAHLFKARTRLHHGRGLAEAGGRAHQRQLPGTTAEDLAQSHALDLRRHRSRGVELAVQAGGIRGLSRCGGSVRGYRGSGCEGGHGSLQRVTGRAGRHLGPGIDAEKAVRSDDLFADYAACTGHRRSCARHP